MSDTTRKWRNLPSEYKDYVFIYIWGFVWALSYLIFTPTATFSILSQVIIYLWTITAMAGAVFALIGLLTGNNLLLERLGVTFLMTAPVAFVLTQTALTFYGYLEPDGPIDPVQRVHLIFLGLWPLLWLNKRRRQLKSRVILAKATPLDGEKRKKGHR